ncbi:Uncharacterized protein YmfQ in lambdoid prophage, DUF2313 family [Faunimonas pinastri]|uniref:Uncharacterized protein YmfQ in lambdoid prophage, DUF2313 family n=1 Tax=Faunimonas pinastri TaxID=1855383 RepID=A0A1H9GDB7_9HYPH|nr:putative phage tail protein [Faunimonas pinastri]SEQ48101.1 Uncharacterized protein YmfQ in lambdoid prophage, DUF2313 family [Faunimonas pinastri]
MTASSGWPCNALPSTPPSVLDKQADPSADDLLPQVLALTPRGAAWGSDIGSDGGRASPVMRSFWKAIAAWVAGVNKVEFSLASQAAFPSAVADAFALADWEDELGLPDPSLGSAPTFDNRKLSLRSKFGAAGNASPSYFLCLALAAGYENLTIEEPKVFRFGESSFGGDTGFGPPSIEASWIVSLTARTTAFRFGEGGGHFGVDPLHGFVRDPVLEALLNPAAPPHTILLFRYNTSASLDFSDADNSQYLALGA